MGSRAETEAQIQNRGEEKRKHPAGKIAAARNWSLVRSPAQDWEIHKAEISAGEVVSRKIKRENAKPLAAAKNRERTEESRPEQGSVVAGNQK
jgi:hypothetical protein